MDGFRLGAVKRILEAEHLRDEPQVDPKKPPVSRLFVVLSPQLMALFFSSELRRSRFSRVSAVNIVI